LTPNRNPRRATGGQDDARGDGITPIVSHDLRRRRDAGWRLPPLDDGARDPLDILAGQSIPSQPIECPGMFGDGGKWQRCCRGVT